MHCVMLKCELKILMQAFIREKKILAKSIESKPRTFWLFIAIFLSLLKFLRVNFSAKF